MHDRPERLDIQVRRARTRRQATTTAIVAGLGVAGLMIYEWAAVGWHWWYIPAVIAAVIVLLWIARLQADFDEEVTRWFWRPPK
jgi:CHASE2 domain-containing sensor protein